MPVDAAKAHLKEMMWKKVGIFRDATSLKEACKDLMNSLNINFSSNIPKDKAVLELRNMLIVSLLAARCALERQESRGGHYRTDFVNKEESWLKHTIIHGR
jgi:succinate dehydrogenase/fumarate reductase flavoprotein subunit